MDENPQELRALLRAVTALQETCEKEIQIDPWEKRVEMIVGQYGRLYARAVELLPDDAYIGALAVDTDPNHPHALNKVNFAASQLSYYLKELSRMPQLTEEI